MLGHLNVSEGRGLHSVEVTSSGEPLTNLDTQVLWFRAK